MRSWMALLSLGLCLSACGDKEDDDEDEDEDDEETGGAEDGTEGTDGSDGTDGGDGTDGTDGSDGGTGDEGSDGTQDESPSISSAAAICIPATSGPEAIVFDIQGADPQGADTIDGGLVRLDTGSGYAFEDLALICAPDGRCTSSVRSEDYSLSCASGPDYTIEAMLTDEDGNSSDWTTVSWQAR